MKFDSVRKQYYLEKQDVYNNSTIREADIADEIGDAKLIDTYLREVSFDVYDIIDSYYNGIHKQKHANAVRFMIHEDERRRVALMDAMIELLRADLTTAYRLNAYDEKGKRIVPPTVERKLMNNDLTFGVEMDFEVDWND